MSDYWQLLVEACAQMGVQDPRIEQLIREDPHNVDPLWVAEKITGKSYKEDKATNQLGFCILLAKRRACEEIAIKMDDTEFSCGVDRYKRIVEESGYRLILKIDEMVQLEYDKTPHPESQYFYWLDGILLVWDTHLGNRNSANLYCTANKRIKGYCCNWIGHDRHDETEDNNYSIQQDGRERIRHHTTILRNSGLVYKVWPKPLDFIWLLAYWDEKSGRNYDEVNQQKYRMFPPEVQACIKMPIN